MLFKLIFLTLISIFSITSAQADDVAACVLGNGDMIHKLSQNADGSFQGHFELPLYRNFEADPTGKTVEVNAPLSDTNIFSNGIPFLKEKAAFMNTIFKKQNLGLTAQLQINFDHCELQSSEDKKLNAWFCNATTTKSLNGAPIHRVDFSIQNQTRTSLIGENGEVADFDVYYVELSFTVPSPNGKTIYKSSHSYFPNGQSTRCKIN